MSIMVQQLAGLSRFYDFLLRGKFPSSAFQLFSDVSIEQCAVCSATFDHDWQSPPLAVD